MFITEVCCYMACVLKYSIFGRNEEDVLALSICWGWSSEKIYGRGRRWDRRLSNGEV